jgi:hypothetical protein
MGLLAAEMIRPVYHAGAAWLGSLGGRVTQEAPVRIGAAVGSSAVEATFELANEVLFRCQYAGWDGLMRSVLRCTSADPPAPLPRGWERLWCRVCQALDGRLPDTGETKFALALLASEVPAWDPHLAPAGSPPGRSPGPCEAQPLSALEPPAAATTPPTPHNQAGDAPTPPPAPVVLGGNWKEPVLVRGRAKGPLPSYTVWKVVRALVDAGGDGLKKDELEAVAGGARKLLRRLRRDADWGSVIQMAGRRGNRYRVLQT